MGTVSAGPKMTGPISVLWREEVSRCGQDLIVCEAACCCQLAPPVVPKSDCALLNVTDKNVHPFPFSAKGNLLPVPQMDM